MCTRERLYVRGVTDQQCNGKERGIQEGYPPTNTHREAYIQGFTYPGILQVYNRGYLPTRVYLRVYNRVYTPPYRVYRRVCNSGIYASLPSHRVYNSGIYASLPYPGCNSAIYASLPYPRVYNGAHTPPYHTLGCTTVRRASLPGCVTGRRGPPSLGVRVNVSNVLPASWCEG